MAPLRRVHSVDVPIQSLEKRKIFFYLTVHQTVLGNVYAHSGLGFSVCVLSRREMLDMLTSLLKNRAPSQPDLPSITELFQLPMKDFDDARNLEKLLRRTFVIGIGGTTNTIVGRVMKSIMTYECGSCFCYVGLNEDKICEVHKSMTRDAKINGKTSSDKMIASTNC
ncbi:hypothetical protein OUZ56_026306 [Daphnia magna]|uniref:Uncharacterized protein n=1 Tax=Daphnia magna TaxID=35525 RepID=A0ABQ9ZLD8_9CRUS|nr:hypothetical protein OUZ56_026306 [Daphnia magna]